MALLVSEDEDLVSSIEFTLGDVKSVNGQKWQEIQLKLTSGPKQIALEKTGNDSGIFLCRQPKDELLFFVTSLEEIVNGTKISFSYEPSEPSFECTLSAVPGTPGYAIEWWLDSGNATTGIYRWDAVGIRFQTVKKSLESFIQQLKMELQPAKI